MQKVMIMRKKMGNIFDTVYSKYNFYKMTNKAFEVKKAIDDKFLIINSNRKNNPNIRRKAKWGKKKEFDKVHFEVAPNVFFYNGDRAHDLWSRFDMFYNLPLKAKLLGSKLKFYKRKRKVKHVELMTILKEGFSKNLADNLDLISFDQFNLKMANIIISRHFWKKQGLNSYIWDKYMFYYFSLRKRYFSLMYRFFFLFHLFYRKSKKKVTNLGRISWRRKRKVRYIAGAKATWWRLRMPSPLGWGFIFGKRLKSQLLDLDRKVLNYAYNNFVRRNLKKHPFVRRIRRNFKKKWKRVK
jgi:hypothetical protein